MENLNYGDVIKAEISKHKELGKSIHKSIEGKIARLLEKMPDRTADYYKEITESDKYETAPFPYVEISQVIKCSDGIYDRPFRIVFSVGMVGDTPYVFGSDSKKLRLRLDEIDDLDELADIYIMVENLYELTKNNN